jgi:chaperonin GroES
MTSTKPLLQPLEDHILISPITEETLSSAGIILPQSDKEKPSKGTVVAVWQGKILDNGARGPMDVSIGDIVYFTKYSPDELEIGTGSDKTKYLVVRHSSILAIEQK